MNINNLNDDCLKQVFSRLSLRDRFRCERVCILWKELILQVFMEQHFLETKSLKEFQISKQFNNFSKILEMCQNLRSIDLSEAEMDDNMVKVILEKCKKLFKIVCISYMTLNDTLMNVLLSGKYANQLTDIAISNQSVTDSGLKSVLKTCTNLKVLDISKNDKITGESSFQYFGSYIKSLNIANCRYIRDNGILSLVSGNGKNLNELKIGTYISENMIKCITNCIKSLTKLSINAYYYPQSFKAHHLSTISNLRKLEKLSLKSLPLLQNSFDETFIAILRGIPKLKSLKLIVAQISDNSFEALPIYCPLLQSFDYQYSTYPSVINNELTNIGANHFRQLNRLRKLSLKGTQIGDTMADVILTNKELVILNLFYCVNLSEVTLNACIDLIKSNVKTKYTIHLKGCKNLNPNVLNLPSNIIIE